MQSGVESNSRKIASLEAENREIKVENQEIKAENQEIKKALCTISPTLSLCGKK